MPLAAYTTGAAPASDDAEEAPDPGYTSVPAASSSTADRLAQAHAADSQPAEPAPAGGKRGLGLRLPKLGRSKQLQADAPFQPVAAGGAAALAQHPAPVARVAQPAAQIAPQPAAFQAVRPDLAPPPPKARAAAPGARLSLPSAPSLRVPGLLAGGSRGMLRDPRVLAGGVVVIGLALLAFSLLGGGGPTSGSGGPTGSQNPVGVVPTAAVLGNATVEVAGTPPTTYTLTGATGSGPAIYSQVNATWTDATGDQLGLTGLASAGTRTTDPDFVLSWTTVLSGAPVTFTSRAAECTVGMAVGVKEVHGTFFCKHLLSPDGKHEVELHGSYQT